MNNETLDIIISLVGLCKKDKKSYVGGKHILWNPQYILNQVLRQYGISQNRILVSCGAVNLWSRISDASIIDKSYRTTIVLEKNEPVEIIKYFGASNEGYKVVLNPGDSFVWNDVFHDEHIIPISVIINRLVNIEKLTYHSVTNILEKMCICKMLKSEDRSIYPKYKRPFDAIRIVEDIYNSNGVYIDNWDVIKEILR